MTDALDFVAAFLRVEAVLEEAEREAVVEVVLEVVLEAVAWLAVEAFRLEVTALVAVAFVVAAFAFVAAAFVAVVFTALAGFWVELTLLEEAFALGLLASAFAVDAAES